MKQYYLPTKIFFGDKTFGSLFPELSAAGVKNPLVICGKHFVSSMKYKELEEHISVFHIFDSVEPNPSVKTVDAAAKMLNKLKCDAVIGIGGGSILDTAKVVACMKGYKNSVKAFSKKIQVKESVPFFAVPTTSGSGSEITKFSVLTFPNGLKQTIKDDKFYAKAAFIDPVLTYSMPPKLTASSGIDAFCQAVESYWAKTSTPETIPFSAESITLSFHSLVKAVKDPDKHVRYNMALASMKAAQAFSQTGTTACHSTSYAFTKKFHLVHGFAVALTLPWFLKFYSEKGGATEKKCLEICSLMGAKTIEQGQEKIRGLLRDIGAPVTLRELGCKKSDFASIIEASLSHKPANPRKHSDQHLQMMLSEIY